MYSHTGHIAYASGGHEPALIATPMTSLAEVNRITELTSTGPPLGAFGAEEVQYTQEEATLAPGATLLLYTDGVTETRRGRVLLGVNRLRQWTARFAALPPARLVQKLVGKVHAFAGNKALRDDLALLILRRRLASKHSK